MRHHRLATPDLGRIFRGESVVGLSDWQLLDRYLKQRDEVAFAALVARHGPMVLGVCRRTLRNPTDVEDAFQATFLVLVRRARQLGPQDAIGPWLHGVATRVALRARCEAARRHRFEPVKAASTLSFEDRSAVNRDLGEILDQELSRLPAKYRHPVVLCYLEGQTHEEAARQLNWPIGTVKGRLSRARDLLQSRLSRRGLAPTAGALTFALSSDVSAAIHHELLDRTVKSALPFALGEATGPIVSASITSLVEGVLTTMFLNSLKWAGVGLFICGLAFTGIGVAMARQDTKAKAEVAPAVLEEPATTSTAAAGTSAKVAPPNFDTPDVISRLNDLRKEHIRAAAREWDVAYGELLKKPNAAIEPVYQASKRLFDAQLPLSTQPDQKVARATEHFDRVRAIARAQQSNASPTEVESAALAAYVAEAGLRLAQAKANETDKQEEAGTSPGPDGDRGKDPKSQAILAALSMPISMPFNEDTALEEVLKYIKQSTATKTYQGIPIYVDPLGLQAAEKSMTSTIRNMDLEGVPLKRTLQLLLKQLDLVYFVEDGTLCITSADSEGRFGPAIHEASPLAIQAEKAERGELTLTEMKDLIEVYKTRAQIKRLAAGEEEQPKPITGGGFGGTFPARHPAAAAEQPVKQGATAEKKESETSKENSVPMNVLLKELRELIEILKAEKQTKQPAAVK